MLIKHAITIIGRICAVITIEQFCPKFLASALIHFKLCF